MNDFGTELRNIRIKNEITQRQLAEMVNVNFTYISKMENGKLENTPSEDTIRRIAEVLHTDADRLLLLAEKVPKEMQETILTDELASVFLRKIPNMTIETKNKIMKIIEEE